MKRRLRDAVRREGSRPEDLVILSKGDYEKMPPLNTPVGQKWLDAFLEAHVPGVDLVIFDNIQALLVGDMKDEERWSKTALCAIAHATVDRANMVSPYRPRRNQELRQQGPRVADGHRRPHGARRDPGR